MPSSRRRGRRPNSREAVKALKVRDVGNGFPRALPKVSRCQVGGMRVAIKKMAGGCCCRLAVWASVVICTTNTVLKVSEFGAEARAELS